MHQRPNSSLATNIISLVNEGQSREGLLLFNQLQSSKVQITEFLLSAVLKCCAKLEALKEGKQTHCVIFKHGFDRDLVLMTSLMDMYSKCISISEARRVFDEMQERDVIAVNGMITGLCRCNSTSEAVQLFQSMLKKDVGSWNSLISGLARNSEGPSALFFFRKMRLEGMKVDLMTMVSVLSVCADLAALVNGKQVHCLVIKHGFEMCLPIGNATIDMYAKSGCINDASLCFNNITFKNIVSWTSLIIGFGKHGLGLEALKAFDQMEMEGIVPNKITFLGVLFACSHAGLVQEGKKNFEKMVRKYSITPMMEHYTCMVDLLARAGRLEEAHEFIKRMPVKPDAKLLTAFLSSCFSYMNVELTRSVGEKLLELQPEEAGAYILLSNFYGLVGDLEGVAKVRRLMLNRGIRKVKACTWIEINGRVHVFESGDRSHPLHKEIYKYVEQLIEKMKKNGYVPNTSLVVQNVDDQKKEEILLGHSEKLAIGFGLISTPSGTKITIVKNLRVCIDCHAATAYISKIVGREIVARDSSRFHQFKDGVCSCGNHW
ncbi:Pentatricopeptide repeat [Macleaya cordata]|uniref:Pentatricopeptide repeat n=1 Tax=Macleaya cordata TaxID=56857 RepID=A0A200QQI1_MACCD|nr:Pentatricopeptide repeat [Macleaya cordata]